jgi:hypothetical protein
MFICRPELLSLEAVFEMSKQEKSEGAQSGESDGCGGCGAIRKKLSLHNALVTFAIYGLALSACTTNLFSPLSLVHAEQRSRWEYFGFSRRPWTSLLLAWHGMTSTTWNPWGFQTNASIDFGLWILCFSWSGTPSPSGSQVISWSDLSTTRAMTHSPRANVCNMYSHRVLNAGSTTVSREVESTTRLTQLAFWLSESSGATQ